jgi:hypothetical protein
MSSPRYGREETTNTEAPARCADKANDTAADVAPTTAKSTSAITGKQEYSEDICVMPPYFGDFVPGTSGKPCLNHPISSIFSSYAFSLAMKSPTYDLIGCYDHRVMDRF